VVLAAAWSLVGLAATGAVLIIQFNHAALARVEARLSETVDILQAKTDVSPDGDLVAPILTNPRYQMGLSGAYSQIAEVDPYNHLAPDLLSPSLLHTYLVEPPGGMRVLEAQPAQIYFYNATGPAGKTLRVGAVYYKSLTGHPTPVVFMAAEDRTDQDKDLRKFEVTTAIALGVVGIGMLLGLFLQVRIGLQPLFDLKREIAEVRQGKSDALAGDYPVELEPLAEELNALVAHNREVVERQRTHVGNLAHALKTPISVMLAEADSAPKSSLAEVVRRQAAAMHGHVDRHLRRAQAAARTQNGHRERTQVAPVLDELARTLERIFRDKGVRIDWDCDEDLCFQGERQDLQEMVGNVMENAGKWCRSRVRVSAEPDGARMRITVEDDGPGLPADRRTEVLKRGARLDEATPGSGLGLSIVEDLTRAYGGEVTLGDSRMGGLLVALRLPRAET
jgi:signal transduction histidine kinase